MTQEHKELLLQDLSTRLPYGIICDDGYGNVLELNGIDKPNTATFKCSDKTFWTTDLDKCKPYLFPLSSMTKEQYNEWCDLGEKPLDNILTKNANGEKMSTLEHHLLVAKSSVDSVNYCYKNHFDIYGLIPMGLAIDATGLNIY